MVSISVPEPNVLGDRLARLVRRASKMQYTYLMLLKDRFTKLKIITKHIRPEKEIKEKNINSSLELFRNVLLDVQKNAVSYLTEKDMWIKKKKKSLV